MCSIRILEKTYVWSPVLYRERLTITQDNRLGNPKAAAQVAVRPSVLVTVKR